MKTRIVLGILLVSFLAGLFILFGPSLEIAKAANLVLSAVAMLFVYRIARRTTDTR